MTTNRRITLPGVPRRANAPAAPVPSAAAVPRPALSRPRRELASRLRPPAPLREQLPDRGVLVDSALYQHGERVASPNSLAKTYRALAAAEEPGTMAWFGLYRPDARRLASFAKKFGLHELALEDAITAHQRPKIERYGETLFVVLHAARYVDATETVEFGELHVFMGPNYLVTLRHAEAPDLSRVRQRMEARPELLALGPEAVLYQILDTVVDGYQPVVDGLQKDIDEIEVEVFNSDPGVSRRIYELSREVAEFRRATRPLPMMLGALMAGFEKYGVTEDLQAYLRDVMDHVQQIIEEVDSIRQALRDMLTVNSTLVAQAQNEEMKVLQEVSYNQNEEVKKISAWAAILFAPSLVPSWYGMNFEHMPELRWEYGVLLAIGTMLALGLAMYVIFKKRKWI